MIEVSNVTKSYGGSEVVRGVTSSLPASGVTSIIGPNGAGKSTFLSMISRLLPMSSGQVTVDGMDILTADGDAMAKKLSILRQDNHLTARLTVRDLVAFGRYPHSKGRPTSDDLAHVERSISYLGLEDLSHRFLDELSGGQRQRAFIAMVLCQDTKYVLLDEPLNNLDMKHAVAMMQLFRRAADELSKSIVLVLHDINFASCYSDLIIAMRDGHLVRQGTPAEIVTTANIHEIFDLEARVETVDGRSIVHFYL